MEFLMEEPLQGKLLVEIYIMMIMMKWFQILTGKFTDSLAFLGGGVIVPLLLLIDYTINQHRIEK